MLEQNEVLIEDVKFMIRKLPTVAARRVMFKIKPVLTGWALVSKAFDGKDSAFIGMVSSLISEQGISEEGLESIIKEFRAVTEVHYDDGRVLALARGDKEFGEVFDGRLELLYAWVGACIELNFKGVMEKIAGSLADANSEPGKVSQ